MATYVNDLRLKEIATGDESGTWGTSTNTNLELIAEAFSFGTEGITTNADTHTTTIADGSTDPGRSIFLKYTGTLDSACTITIGPNTVSKLWLIENATSGSQNIIIKQGSGATVTIANGQTKAIYSDGAGSGGAMVDAFQDLSIPDLFIDDDLTFTSDSAVITFGADGDTTLTHTDGSGLTLNSTNKLMFNDASQFIQGSSATVLSLGATDEIDLTATLIDINGNADVSGTVTATGTSVFASLDISGDIDVDGTTNLDVVDIDGAVDMASTLQVDGAITSSAGATITVADNSDTLTLISTDADANVGPVLVLKRNSASAADNDFLGRQQFVGKNDADEEFVLTDILTRITDASDGTEDARFDLNTMVAGTSRNRITVSATETIMNEGSVDLDFRVESDGQANMLFVDGGNDYVSIKTGSSINGGTLSVAGSIAFDGQSVSTYNDASGWIDFTSTSDTNLMRLHSGGDSGESSQIEISTVVSGSQSDAITVESGGTIVINQDSAAARDFRVESDGNTNAIFVDAGNDRVGILNDASMGSNFNVLTQMSLGADNNNRAILDFSSAAFSIGTIQSGTSTFSTFSVSSGAVFCNNSTSLGTSLIINNTSNGSGSTLKFLNDSSSPANDDVLGSIDFNGNDDGGTQTTFARIRSGANNVANGSESGFTSFAIQRSGSLEEHMRVNTAGVVVNEISQAQTDFRVESNDNTHMLFVDSGANSIGINASNPTHPIDITANSSAHGVRIRGRSADDIGELNFQSNDGGTAISQLQSLSTELKIRNITNIPMSFHTNNTERVSIESDGRIFMGTTTQLRTNETLHVKGTEGLVSTATANGGGAIVGLEISSNTLGSTFVGLDKDGGVVFRVAVGGNVTNTNNSYGAISDQKVKENIADASSQWDDIKAVRVRNYSMIADKESSANRIGVVAQELESAGMGGLVETKPDIDPDTLEDLGTTTKSVKYSVLYMKAIKALQEAMEKIETLETKVAALEGGS